MSLFQLLFAFEENSVAYCLVGGFAAVAYGSTMVTQDIDVATSMETETLLNLHTALLPYKPQHRLLSPPRDFTREEVASGRFKNLYLNTSLGKIDCPCAIKGVGDFNSIFARSHTIALGASSIRVIDLAALIQAKEAMGRPKDIENVKILRAIQQKKRHE